MRYSLLPDPARLNPGFMQRDRGVHGLGASTDADIPANPDANGATAPTFWGSLGTVFTDLTKQYGPGLVNWGITGNRPQSVVTPQGTVTTIPGGTKTMASATGQTPPWLIPALIGGGVLLFLVMKSK